LALTIPSRHVLGFAKIISLPDEPMNALFTALSEVSPSLDLKSVASAVASRVESVPRAEINRIVRAILSLYSARAYPDVPSSSADDFVDDIWEAMSQSGRKELLVTEENKDRIKARLKRLLSLEALNVVSKALNLRSEHEHILCSARILTDVRPLYGPNPKVPPNAVVITHMLRLAYHEGDKIKEIYIALDAEDIKELRVLLDRAESKADSVKALFDSLRLPTFT